MHGVRLLDLGPCGPTPHQYILQCTSHVRFGSQADIGAATSDVCFTPNSDRKRRHAAMEMSALHLKVDMCSAVAHVCFGPIADIMANYSITSSAKEISPAGM